MTVEAEYLGSAETEQYRLEPEQMFETLSESHIPGERFMRLSPRRALHPSFAGTLALPFSRS